jgi:hypothetical protein
VVNKRWVSNLVSKEEQEQFEEKIKSSQIILDRLTEICYNMIKESENRDNDYDSPSWAYKQADSNGYRRALENIIKLTTYKSDKD